MHAHRCYYKSHFRPLLKLPFHSMGLLPPIECTKTPPLDCHWAILQHHSRFIFSFGVAINCDDSMEIKRHIHRTKGMFDLFFPKLQPINMRFIVRCIELIKILKSSDLVEVMQLLCFGVTSFIITIKIVQERNQLKSI